MRGRPGPDRGLPSSVIVPASGLRMSVIMRISVVLPAPFGPSSAKISPGATSNDTSFTTARSS